MMTMLLVALTLTSIKLEAPQFRAPKMQLDLPGLPKAEGLVESSQAANLTSRKAVESDTLKASPAKVEEVQLSRTFVTTTRGLRALEPVDAFLVPTVPAQLPNFKACVRVASPDRMPARVKVQIRLPGGAEFVSVSKNVSFDQDWADVVFDFPNLKVQQGGTYKVVVSLDGAPVLDLPFEVTALKQAAEPSGR